jgi:hypothetical protein
MELYTLDSLLRRTEVIDKWESMLWAERMAAFGDFELQIAATADARRLLVPSTKVALNESHRVMTIETVEDKTDDDGQALLEVKGRSLEQIMDERTAMHTGFVGANSGTKWVFTDWLPAEIARHIFSIICTPNIYNIDPGDIIPGIVPGTLFPPDSIPEPEDPVTMEFSLGTVYAHVKEVCDLYGLGFRLYRNFDTSVLHFEIYAGSDRTTQQTVLPAIIFTPELDNMKNTTELVTIAPHRNVAYVFSPVGYRLVYSPGVDPEAVGFERRVLTVDANDIDLPAGPAHDAALEQRGREELIKNRGFSAFDGEINQRVQYKYGVDYHLGDLVELRSSAKATSNMRVTEQIFVSDQEGERSYPTLASNLVIEEGTWLAQRLIEWQDYDDDYDSVWANQP